MRIQVRNPFSGEQEYIKQIQSDAEAIDKIDVNAYVLTTYQVNEYVLRRYILRQKLVGEIHTNTAHGSVVHTKSLKYYNIVIRI